MTDEVESLVLEHLRAIRSDVAALRDEVRGLRAEQTASRLEARAMNTRIEQILEDDASFKTRLDRIEARLGLVDAAK